MIRRRIRPVTRSATSIPDAVSDNRVNHRQSTQSDNSITFTPIIGFTAAVSALMNSKGLSGILCIGRDLRVRSWVLWAGKDHVDD